MRNTRHLGALLPLLVLGSACQLVLPLHHEEEDGFASDASAAEAASPDAAPGIDASGRDAASGDAGGTGFCAMAAHDVCDDFDEDPYAGWALLDTDGTLGADPDASVSPPDSLLVSLASSGLPRATLGHGLPTSAAHVVCQLQLRVETLASTDTDDFVLSLSASSAAVTSYTLAIILRSKDRSIALFEFGARSGGDTINSVKDDIGLSPGTTWSAITLDATLAPSGATATVAVDGTPQGQWPLAAFTGSFDDVTIGAQASGTATGATRLRLDDVTCDHVTP